MIPVCENCGGLITTPGKYVRYCSTCARERLLRSILEDPDEDDETPEDTDEDERKIGVDKS